MSDTKISAMTPAATLDGTEIVPLVQAGGNVQTTTANFVGQTILADPPTYRTDLGLGTMAVQDADNVAIVGGAIDATTFGGTTPARVNTDALKTTALTGYLYGNGSGGDVTASTTIPWSDITGAPTTAAPAYGAFHQDGVTTLTDPISNNSTAAIVVGDTSSFPAGGGYILIGSEIIQYTSKTATTFDGTVTRGVLGTTNVSHLAGAQISEVQGTGSPTTIGSVLFNNTDFSNDVTVTAGKDEIKFLRAGIYNVQVSAQLLNFTTSEDNVTLWFTQNGDNIAASASIQQVNQKHGGSPGSSILSLNIFVQAAANDTIGIKWATDTGNSVIATYPEGTSPVHPVSPAIILTATQVG